VLVQWMSRSGLPLEGDPTRRRSSRKFAKSAADYGKHASSGIEVDRSTLGAINRTK